MAATTISTETLRENLASAEHLAQQGPVFVADSGATRFVILNPAEYRRLAGIPAPASGSDTKPFRSLADAFTSTCLTEADQDFDLETMNSAPSAEAPPFRSLADLFSIPGLTAEAADFEFQELQWETAPADFS